MAGLCAEYAEEQLRHWPLEKRNRLLRHALALHQLGAEKRISDFEAFFEFKRLQDANPMEAEKRLASPSPADMDEFENDHWQEVSDLVFAYFAPEEHLTLSALQEHFDLAEQDREECQMLASTLAPWCRGGNCGVLFDGATNVATSERVVHYELGFIGESAKEIKAVVGFILINSIRNRVMLMPRHLKKRIVVEEVSRFLDVPGGEAILRECFEQFRKFNVQVIIVAQQYSRIADTPIRAAIVGNARAWIIFNTGDRRDVERLGVDLGLSRVAVETILRFPRPDQQTGVKYSEFLYYHTDTVRPICGTVRYYRLPTEPIFTTNETLKQTTP